MSATLAWLHLSDLHACKPQTGWDAKRVTDTLCADLKRMQKDQGLRPDLIFFTGDAAFGQVGKERGEAIVDQFREAHDFLTAVREAFDPIVDQRNLFLVPGNHDVNRDSITSFETDWLGQARSLGKIERLIQQMETDWRSLLGRLDDYAQFLESYGYDHLLTGRERLIYADAREVAGLRVGIAGFNSAWSSRGAGREEMGRLWMAGRFQLETLRQQLPPNDFTIALIHHPSNWLVPEENPSFGRQLERDFPFVLHGHEHQEFVRPDATIGHTVISAGACHECSESKNNGFNFVRLDLEKGTGEVWLRQYDASGGGWVPRCIANRTDDHGMWPLTHLEPWLGKLIRSREGSVLSGSSTNIKKTDSNSEPDGRGEATPNAPLDPASDYEIRYRKAVADRLDYVQLFGIEVPKESKEYSLTVAYVSLNLADEDEEESEEEDQENGSPEEREELGPSSLPVEQFFDGLRPDAGRLLIRGAAGCGKTTLLRWAAVQAGKVGDVTEETDLSRLPIDKERRDHMRDMSDDRMMANGGDWRAKVPFVIRLRDCPDGKLPRPNDFPLLLAKELPDPPTDWVDDVLRNGRGLVMFDGADEVLLKARDEVVREIRQLMQTYPDNYYVMTTRPEAIERPAFLELGFTSARVESMATQERDTFIDRWHEAMEVRLQNWNEPADLRPLAKRLKQRLEEAPAIARLTVNPLLCAVVCALHRERNENLPETPVELCEKLCEMLLHRRDQERLGLDARKIADEAYGRLEFRVRKGLLSKLAHHMVSVGVSAIDEAEADEQIAEALQSYNLSDVQAIEVRKALVERSGMLQESSEKRIEFLHNTLKEYLAAERFANIGEVQTLAEHVGEASWQPVILFAVALPRDGSSFATALVHAIFEITSLKPPPKGRSKEARENAAKLRAQQFFFFRCCTNSYQLSDASVSAAFSELSKNLLPPRNITDAEALATCGEAVIPYLANRADMRAAERSACVRALGLIGGSRARTCLESYFEETTGTVGRELIEHIEDALTLPSVLRDIEQSGEIPYWARKKIYDMARLVSSLRKLSKLTTLDLSGTQVSDISALGQLGQLTTLDLSGTQVSDISALGQLGQLTTLDLSGTQVSDISVLRQLGELTTLKLSRTQASDISVLGQLGQLTSLNLWDTQASDISALGQLRQLTSLDLWGTQVSDISALGQLRQLTSLDLWGTQVSDISALGQLRQLTSLKLSYTQVSDISALGQLRQLTSLDLWGTQVSDISALGQLRQLTSLDLWGTQVSDISALGQLGQLTSLDLRNTQASDISALGQLRQLTSLDLWGTQVSDISALGQLGQLTSLDLRNTQVSDISALGQLRQLTSLNLWGTQVSDISALGQLGQLTSLDLRNTQVSDISALSRLGKLRILHVAGWRVAGADIYGFKVAVPKCTVKEW